MEAQTSLPPAPALPLAAPSIADLTSEQAEAIAFAEGLSMLEMFLEARLADPATRLLSFRPDDFSASEEATLRAWRLLFGLAKELATPLDPCRVFRACQQPLLFSSLAGCSGPSLEQAGKVGDYFQLPLHLSLACRQQLAISATVAEESLGGAARPEGKTFLDLLSKDEDLKVMLDAAWASINATITAVFGQRPRCKGWHAEDEGPGRAAFIDGLTGKKPSKEEEDSEFYNTYSSCGLMLAGEKAVRFSACPLTASENRSCWSLPARLAAFLGRQDVLQALEEHLGKAFPSHEAAWTATAHGRVETLQWLMRGPGKDALSESIAEGVVEGGTACLPALKWYFEEYKGDRHYKEDIRRRIDVHGMTVWRDLALPVADYLSAQDEMAPSQQIMAWVIARTGDLARLTPFLQDEELRIGTVEAALHGGHAAIADSLLGMGVKWHPRWNSGLFDVCVGFKGDHAAFDYWETRGCPNSPKHLAALCNKAAARDLVAALEWASKHANFPGWGKCIRSTLEEAIRHDQEGVVAWITTHVPFASVAATAFPSPTEVWNAVSWAVEGAHLKIVQLLHAWGMPMANMLLRANEPHRKPVFDFLLAVAPVIDENGWQFAGSCSVSVKLEHVTLLVEKFGFAMSPSFLLGAAKWGNTKALDYCWGKGGIFDPTFCVLEALKTDEPQTLEWLSKKMGAGAFSSLPLSELIKSAADSGKSFRRCRQWLERAGIISAPA